MSSIQDHKLTRFPNILLVAGTGRNVGKTEFVCQCIEYFSKRFPVTGLKVTNHFHEGEERTFSLKKEIDFNSHKDTSRMLRAGAQEVFYCQSESDYLQQAFDLFQAEIPDNSFIICESGALRNIIEPGLFIVVQHIKLPNMKPQAQHFLEIADRIVTSDGKRFNITPKELNWI